MADPGILGFAFWLTVGAIMLLAFGKNLFVFFERRTTAGAVGDNGIDIQIEEQIEIVGRQLAGGVTISFGEMRRAAAFLFFGGDHIKPLVTEHPYGLPGDFGVHQGHDAAEKEADLAAFFSSGRGQFR